MAEEKTNSTIAILLLIAVFILASYYIVKTDALPSRNSFDDAKDFFNIFQGLVRGDTQMMSENAQGGLTFIGLFILLFVVLFFVFKTSLHHIFNKNASVAVSFIMTVYAFTNNVIYSYIVGFSAYLVSILVFLAIISMLWGAFGNITDKDSPKD